MRSDRLREALKWYEELRTADRLDWLTGLYERINPMAAAALEHLALLETGKGASRMNINNEEAQRVKYCTTHHSIDIYWDEAWRCINGEYHIGETEIEDGWDCVVVSKLLVDDLTEGTNNP